MSFFTVVVIAALLATVAPLISDIYSKATGRKVRHMDSLHAMEWQIGGLSIAALLLVLFAIYLAG